MDSPRQALDAGARVAALYIVPVRHAPLEPVPSVRALADHGFEGDAHARPGSDRQLLLMDAETVRELGLEPGVLKENITTSGLRLYEQQPGQRLRIGTAVLELTSPCPPCGKMEAIRLGLRQELAGRRGYLAKVVESGDLSTGDAITPA
jgi:MOSC domain-containing protein YiiM